MHLSSAMGSRRSTMRITPLTVFALDRIDSCSDSSIPHSSSVMLVHLRVPSSCTILFPLRKPSLYCLPHFLGYENSSNRVYNHFELGLLPKIAPRVYRRSVCTRTRDDAQCAFLCKWRRSSFSSSTTTISPSPDSTNIMAESKFIHAR